MNQNNLKNHPKTADWIRTIFGAALYFKVPIRKKGF